MAKKDEHKRPKLKGKPTKELKPLKPEITVKDVNRAIATASDELREFLDAD